MIIDFHVHPFLNEKEILNQMEKANIDKVVLLAVDADPLDVDKPEIKKRLRESHLESLFKFRALRFTSVEEEIKQFFQQLIMYYPELKTSNQEIAELVKKSPQKFIGFGSINPNRENTYVESKLKEITSLELKGIKMLPTLQLFSPIKNKNFEKICEYCEKNKLVILYHTGCDPGPWEVPELSEDANPKYLRSVLESYKPIIVLAHAGSYSAYKPGIWFEEAIDLAKSFENVYFDSAAVSSFIYSEKILNRIREEIGLERLLYGSDYPVVWGSDMAYEVNFIKKCKNLTEEEKEKILGLNAMKILNL
ncbi:MAG: amidohydrolase family protein [Candidatus Bathyarchaeia archaeon]|nr:amidohydrolase family protein [Candidatus Bathyarchaeia archaeon]